MTHPRARRLNRIFRLTAFAKATLVKTAEATEINGGILASALLAALASGAVHLSAQPPAPSTGSGQAGLRVEISFSAAARSEPVTGMVYLAISKNNQSTPIQQTDPEGVPVLSAIVPDPEPE